MKLYLSSFRVGSHPEALIGLLGKGTRTALILNADDYKEDAERSASLEREVRELTSLGLDPYEVDLREFFGRKAALEGELAQAELVYVRGGNVFLLARALRYSGADEIISNRISERSVVYGGYSAACCVLGPTLRGHVGVVDDPVLAPAGYEGTETVWEGMGILPYAFAPHYKSDHPETGEIDRTVAFYIDNHIPFIALKDGQVLVVDGSSEEVLG